MVFEQPGAGPDLLIIIDSYGFAQPDEWVLKQLKRWNVEKRKKTVTVLPGHAVGPVRPKKKGPLVIRSCNQCRDGRLGHTSLPTEQGGSD
jgi:hypothetical protein